MKQLIVGGIVVAVCSIALAQYVSLLGNDSKREESVTDDRREPKATVAGEPIVTPISHASFVMEWGDIVIYNDPVGEVTQYTALPAPDLILLSDVHGDHLSTTTLLLLSSEATIIAPQAVMDLLPESLRAQTVVLENNVSTHFNGLLVTAMPMYNLPESEDSRHSKGRGNGYLVEGSERLVYIAGDTSGIPEMRALTNIDIAFIPMNLPYTMGVEEAADAVLAFAPRTVIPYHYRTPDGLSDIASFKNLVEAGSDSIEVRLLDWYPATE